MYKLLKYTLYAHDQNLHEEEGRGKNFGFPISLKTQKKVVK